jgi:type VI secretion system protein ImpJ
MRNLPVHWHEGLFLRPHHFQAAERHWAELLQTSERWDNPYNFGLHRLEFSRDALGNHQFQVHALEARLRDGTLVGLESGQEPDRVDLKEAVVGLDRAMTDLTEAFETAAVVRVYLAVPKLKLGLANVAVQNGPATARYVASPLEVQDEAAGGNDQEIQFRRLNVRLVLSTQDLSGYDLLPIAQIKRAGEGEALPQLDESYIPPVLSIDAWPGLGRDLVRALYDVIGQKIEVLSQQVINRGVGLDSRHPGDLDRVLMLSVLNEANATLAVLAFARGIHPLVAYTELCRIAGRLSIFGPERRLDDVPPYDHEDLARIFPEIKLRIEALINAVRAYEFEQRSFVGVGLGMQVSLEPRWFNSDWQWYVGAKDDSGQLSPQEIRDLLSPGFLDWKLGSSRQVEMLFKNRMEGLELRPLDRAIRALPAGQDWVYYEVPRKDAPAWRDVQETQTLAMRLKDSLIVNLNRLQGERQLVVSARGGRVPMEFALFAVPVQT